MSSNEPWGTFAPSFSTLPLRAITRCGLSRGAICQWIRRQWLRSHPEVVDAEIRGIKYRLNIRRNTTDAKLLASSSTYDQQEIDALCSVLISRSSVFVDAGANTGYYSTLIAKQTPAQVVSIEPNPPTLELLRYNVELNGLQDKVMIVPLCVAEGGSVPFYCASGLGGASVFRPDGITPAVMVESAPLLDIVRSQNLSEVTALKIDIEGYEDKALFHYFEKAPPEYWPKVVVIEDCHRFDWELDIISHMTSRGYTVSSTTRGNSILTM